MSQWARKAGRPVIFPCLPSLTLEFVVGSSRSLAKSSIVNDTPFYAVPRAGTIYYQASRSYSGLCKCPVASYCSYIVQQK